MPALVRLARLARYGLLLFAAACQRPVYQLSATSGYSSLVAEPVSPDVSDGAAGPAAPARTGAATVAAESQHLRRVCKPQRPAGARPVGKLPRAIIGVPVPPAGIAAADRRPDRIRQPAARRPTIDDATQFKLLGLGGALLLTAAGLALSIVVGGWLAVAGGVVLILCGIGLAALCWYASGIGSGSQH